MFAAGPGIDVREDIAADLDSLEGISATPYYVDSTNPGTAFIQLDRIEYPDPGMEGICHWKAIVLLVAEDYEASEKFLEDRTPDLVDVLNQHLSVTSVTRERMSIPGASDIPCVVFNGHREQEL